MAEVDAEVLISLVQARPVLWDKTLEIHKDRNATRNAWREVCLKLKPDFDMIEHNERNAFGKEVIRRWTNLRDSFAKSKRRMKDNKKDGSKAKRVKTYIFSDQMQFLDKLYDSQHTMYNTLQSESDAAVENSLDANTEPPVSVEDWENCSTSHECNTNTKRVPQARNRKYRKPDEVELKILKALEADKPCAKISFLNSLMPHLDKFDEQDFLQFQIGVLKVIENINDRKKIIAAHSHRFNPMLSDQQLSTQSSSRPQEVSNHPSSTFPVQLHLSDAVPSQISISHQPPLYSSHQLEIRPLHKASSPPRTPSHNNETNANQHPQPAQCFQQSGQCTSPKSDLKYSPAASAGSSSADNIDFDTSN